MSLKKKKKKKKNWQVFKKVVDPIGKNKYIDIYIKTHSLILQFFHKLCYAVSNNILNYFFHIIFATLLRAVIHLFLQKHNKYKIIKY